MTERIGALPVWLGGLRQLVTLLGERRAVARRRWMGHRARRGYIPDAYTTMPERSDIRRAATADLTQMRTRDTTPGDSVSHTEIPRTTPGDTVSHPEDTPDHPR